MIKSFIEAAGEQTILLMQTFYWTIIGVDSFMMVAISGFALGAVLVVQIGFQFANMGAQSYVGGVVALSMTREIAPLMTAIVVAGRIGSSMAAEIGTMKITEQIDALETMATNPVDYLVVPRFWACTFMLFLLTVVSNAFGMVGGSITAVYQVGLTFESFKDSILYLLKIQDLLGGLLKAVIFGGIISIIGCYKGFTTEGGAEGVGKSTTSAVVIAIMLIIAVNFFLTVGITNFTSAYLQ